MPYYRQFIKHFGEMAEWPKATVSKTVVGFCLPWVQIPLSPPILFLKSPMVPQGVTIRGFFCGNRILFDEGRSARRVRQRIKEDVCNVMRLKLFHTQFLKTTAQ